MDKKSDEHTPKCYTRHSRSYPKVEYKQWLLIRNPFLPCNTALRRHCPGLRWDARSVGEHFTVPLVCCGAQYGELSHLLVGLATPLIGLFTASVPSDVLWLMKSLADASIFSISEPWQKHSKLLWISLLLLVNEMRCEQLFLNALPLDFGNVVKTDVRLLTPLTACGENQYE